MQEKVNLQRSGRKPSKYKDKTREACPPMLPSADVPENWRWGPVVERMTEDKDWQAIIDLLVPRLVRHGSDHWLHLQLSSAYSKLDNTDESSEESDKHLSLACDHGPDCPWVAMKFAKRLVLFDVYKDAISFLKSLLEVSIADMMADTCFVEVRAARQLRHEAYDMLLDLYKKTKQPKAAAVLKKRQQDELERERESGSNNEQWEVL